MATTSDHHRRGHPSPGSRPGLRQRRAHRRERLAEHPRYPQWVLATTLTGMFATTFPVVVLVAAIPDIAADLGTRETVLAWVVTLPLLASAVAMPVLGKFGDLYGHRRVFLTGFVAATALALATALAWNAVSLIGFRTAAMAAAAATQPTAVALIMASFPVRKRVRAMGLWSFVGAGSPALGLAIGGPLVDLLGWRVIFLIQTGLSVVALAAAATVLRETRPSRTVRFDTVGAVTLAGAAGSLLFAFQQGADWGWSHPAVLVGAVAAPTFGLLFRRVEQRADAPLLPLEFLRSQAFVRPLTAMIFLQSVIMGGFIITPLFLTARFGSSVAQISLVMIALPGFYSIASPIGGRLGERFGEGRAVVAGAVLQVASMGTLVAAGALSAFPLVPVGLGLLGMSSGLSRPSITTAVANAVGDDNLGVGAAVQRMTSEIAGAVGVSAWVLLAARLGFTEAYMFGAATTAVAVATAARIRRTPTPSTDVGRGDRGPSFVAADATP